MARTTASPADPTRRAAFAAGLFYLVTFASSIPAWFLIGPVLDDPAYIVGPGLDRQVLLGCLLDLVNALTAVGSAVAVYSVIKRRHESLALGFVTTRLFEAATIVIGICALLAVVSIRQAGPAAGTDDASLVAMGQGLVAVRDWTFVIGPGLMPGFNALLFATVLYRSRLVPRLIPAMGLVGAPLLIASASGMILGLHEAGSAFSAIATMPIFFWELSVGVWMTFKGFSRSTHILSSGSTSDTGDTGPAGDGERGATRVAGPVATPAGASPAVAAAPRRGFHLRPRHLLILGGLSLAIVGNAVGQQHGIGLATVIGFSLLPSLPLLLGIGQRVAPGRVARRVVRPLNVLREPLLPVAAVALGAAGLLPVVAIVGGLVWLGSIVIAWGLGDGLRERDGSLRPVPTRLTSLPIPSQLRGASTGTAGA